jgi:hypothetical protein
MEKDQPTGAVTFPHARLEGAHNHEEDRVREPIHEEFPLPILPIDP